MSDNRIYSDFWKDYELIDAGGGKKLERWGKIITIRPEVQAYFKSEIPFAEWEKKAHFEFIQKGAQSGVWKKLKAESPEKWNIQFDDLTFNLELTKFKHVGLFPEQSTNWRFIQEHLVPSDRFLNLFAYTGAASVVANAKKAETFHVDSVKQLVTWAKSNMESSQQENIKWVLEDALKFAQRELKRGNKYKGIIMDPPAWGIGAKGEKWKLEDKLPELLELASKLLENDGFLILNTYSPTIKLGDIQRLTTRFFAKKKVILSELWMRTTTGKELYYGNLLRVVSK